MKLNPSLLAAMLVVLARSPPGIPDEGLDTQVESPGADAGAEHSMDDPWHCGEEDLKCIGPLGIGECVDGECQGRLTFCHLAAGTCAEICANDGGVCAPLDCEGATAFAWDYALQEEADALCDAAIKDAATPLEIGCDDELNTFGKTVNCCCQW
ncbi:hypothetical protein PPSIR1_40245 [Plesiocystis pacifica SIR-1]|uniref:Uncharacterized protein n=1 Tax=Plesiocystis pacifica SIR-1 TaxID=391625 RepID=A6FYH9_9BACT|nr:hypothetical protein [Plesiocystis pacifica]EDM81251.1 hypothetical protein PPSIR1_40245 [Plesiocystis pacifica SIR-1]